MCIYWLEGWTGQIGHERLLSGKRTRARIRTRGLEVSGLALWRIGTRKGHGHLRALDCQILEWSFDSKLLHRNHQSADGFVATLKSEELVLPI